MVRPPSPEHEDERRLSRERGTLLKERLRLSNRIKGLCAAQARAEGGSKLAALLRLKGIGPEVATVLELEVFHRHFANRRDVAAYAGLAPSPYASGGTSREQGISKAGNRRARKALIELAWLWLRHQPESALARWYRDRVGTATGRVKRIAIVALARKLLVAIWRYVETGLVPAEATVRT